MFSCSQLCPTFVCWPCSTTREKNKYEIIERDRKLVRHSIIIFLTVFLCGGNCTYRKIFLSKNEVQYSFSSSCCLIWWVTSLFFVQVLIWLSLYFFLYKNYKITFLWFYLLILAVLLSQYECKSAKHKSKKGKRHHSGIHNKVHNQQQQRARFASGQQPNRLYTGASMYGEGEESLVARSPSASGSASGSGSGSGYKK